VAIDGVGSPQRAQELKSAAESTMERLRHERIQQASSRSEPLTEREKLRFVRGVGMRTLQLLEEAGYRTVQDLAREDADRLAIKTGLGIKKARQVQQGAIYFLENESRAIEAARSQLPAPSENKAFAAAEMPKE
jgi:N utilization substance protein A